MKFLNRARGMSALLNRDRLEARQQEDDLALWRDYRRFLQAHLALLDARIAESHAAFERAADVEAAAQAAQTTLDALPPGLRALFAAVVAQRTSAVQAELEAATGSAPGGRRRAVDPDSIDRQVLTTLLGEAEGTTTEDGLGRFPRGMPGNVTWYGFAVADLLSAPTAATYALVREGTDTRRRLIQAGGAGVGLIVFLIVWFSWAGSDSTPPSARVRLPQVNGMAVTVWPVTGVQVPQDGLTRTLTVQRTTDPIWTAVPNDQAGWQASQVAPLRVCLPADLLATLPQIQVVSGGELPDRVYTLSTTAPAQPDLVVAPCQPGRSGAARRYGMLRATLPQPWLTLGTPATLPDATTLTVAAISVAGSALDPTLPLGQARVLVTVEAPAGLDWPAYAPTLLLPGGERLLPSVLEPGAGQTTLAYLVPLPTTPQAIGWIVTPPGDAHGWRWRATIAPPADRATVLQTALQIGLPVARLTAGGTISLTLPLTNQGATPLTVTPADITLRADDQPLPLPPLAGLDRPLAPGEQRILVMTLPGGPATALTLTVGGQIFDIQQQGGGMP